MEDDDKDMIFALKFFYFIVAIVAYAAIPPLWFVNLCDTGYVFGRECVMGKQEAWQFAVIVWNVSSAVLAIHVVPLCYWLISSIGKKQK